MLAVTIQCDLTCDSCGEVLRTTGVTEDECIAEARAAAWTLMGWDEECPCCRRRREVSDEWDARRAGRSAHRATC